MLSNDPNMNYNSIIQDFLETIEKHAPLKTKLVKVTKVNKVTSLR